jgi:hypothetical protein
MDSIEKTFSAAFMPSGKPAPAVMTSEETAMFLRLDGNGQRALKYWRDQGELVGIKIGRRIRYPLDEVLKFLAEKVARSKNNKN